jgi:hypothetical protein
MVVVIVEVVVLVMAVEVRRGNCDAKAQQWLLQLHDSWMCSGSWW